MKVKQGDRLRINDSEKGSYVALASADFDTEADEFYPLTLDQDAPLTSALTGASWNFGEAIPARRDVVTIEALNAEPFAGHSDAFAEPAQAAVGDGTVTVTNDPPNNPAAETASSDTASAGDSTAASNPAPAPAESTSSPAPADPEPKRRPPPKPRKPAVKAKPVKPAKVPAKPAAKKTAVKTKPAAKPAAKPKPKPSARKRR